VVVGVVFLPKEWPEIKTKRVKHIRQTWLFPYRATVALLTHEKVWDNECKKRPKKFKESQYLNAFRNVYFVFLFVFVCLFVFQKSEKLIILFSWKRTTSQLSPTKGPGKKRERDVSLLFWLIFFFRIFFFSFFLEIVFPRNSLLAWWHVYMCVGSDAVVFLLFSVYPPTPCRAARLVFHSLVVVILLLSWCWLLATGHHHHHIFSPFFYSPLFFLYFYKRDRHVHKRSSSPYLCNDGSSSFTSRVSSIL
jgi:predicted neutral ceramidase superfamily lipid hydrolase